MNPNQDYDLQEISLSLLLEIGKLLESREQSDDVLNPALMILADQLSLEDTAITIFDNKSKEIYIDTAYGLSSQQRSRGRYQLGEGIIGEVVQSKNQIIVPKISQEPRFLGRTKKRSNVSELSFICVPIRYRKEVTGTLSITLPFQPISVLEKLAGFITIISFLLLQPIILQRQLVLAHQEIESYNNPTQKLSESDINALIGNSRSIKYIKNQIYTTSKEDTPLFISGEAGTGKTFISNLIHNIGIKRDNRLIQFTPSTFSKVDIIPLLVGSTDPHSHIQNSKDYLPNYIDPIIHRSQNTTLLIEDIEYLTLEAQQLLLQIIQSQEIFIDDQITKLSIRYIFTSNNSLPQLKSQNKIVDDLFEILVHNTITLPPLRDRRDDIILFADYFTLMIIESLELSHRIEYPRRLSTPAIDLLTQYHWPGNLNELYKVMEIAVHKSEGGVIHAHTFPPSLQSAKSTNTQGKMGFFEAVERLEKDLIIDALKTTGGHMTNAAKILNISDRILGLRIRKYNIQTKLYK